MIGVKITSIKLIRNIGIVCACLFLSVQNSFSQQNKNSITEEYLTQNLAVISAYYDVYNIYVKDENKALNALEKYLTKVDIDNESIQKIKNDLMHNNINEVQELLDKKGHINSTDTLIMYNNNLVSNLFKRNLKSDSDFSSFYQRLKTDRDNYINSSRIIISNFNEFKQKGLIDNKFKNFEEYITLFLSKM